MKINGFTKVCLVLLIIVGGLLALNWPFQSPAPTRAVGVLKHHVASHAATAVHAVHTLTAPPTFNVTALAGAGVSCVILVVIVVVVAALIAVSRRKRGM